MKRKFLMVLTIIMVMCSTIGLTACGGNNDNGETPPHTHEYTILKHNATEHWYECSCGDKIGIENHKGGTATETQRPVCSVCNQEYGESLGHVHTLHLTKVDAKPQSCTKEGNIEYYTCSCDKWFTDNTATTEITDKTSVVIAKDNHKHNILKHNETEHWYECYCGDKTTVEEHKGGTATCQVKATCSVCGEKYGTLGSHQPKTEWATTETHHYHECKTSGCTEKLNYGEHNFDSYKKCSGCDYVTTALLGTEISSNVYEISGTNLFVKVPNAQTNFSFAKTINVAKGATYKAYTDISCKEEYCIPSYVVNDLKEENNVYYFLVSNGDELPQVYTVTVRRRPKYTVTFNTDGGSYVAPQTIEEDALATKPNNPTKTGYNFVSWDYDFNTPITTNKTIKANWAESTKTPYRVEYYLENLENDNYTLQTFENKTGTTNSTVYAEIKTFEHFTAEQSSVSGVINANGTTVIKVYYQRNEYTITFDGNGGTLVSGKATQTVKYGGSVIAPTFAKEGYSFVGFNKSLTNVSENCTVTANWKINQYSITIVYDNGQENTVLTQDYGTAIQNIAEPTRAGYTFNGWDKEIPSKMPAEDMTITANWKINQYSITIVYGNGQENKIITQDYNSDVEEIDIPERLGYTFDGWDKEIPIKMPAEDVIITANWDAIEYDIDYNLNKGKLTTDKNKYTIEQAVVLDKPTRDYYIFSGWYNNANFSGNATTGITLGTYGDVELYAKWTPIDYDITYVLNGGINDKNNPAKYNVETETTTLNEPTKKGYTFDGWYLEEGFITKVTEIEQGSYGNITLYAKWSENINWLNFDGNGSTSGEMQSIELKTGETKPLPTNPFVRIGYTFKGWAESENGEVLYTDGAKYTMGTESQCTLYAVWEANLNTIYFNANGATNGEMSSIQARTGETITLPSNVYYLSDDYTFGGWAISETGSCKYYNGATYVVSAEAEQTLYAYWKQQTKDGLSWSLSDNEITITDCLTFVTNIAIPSTIVNYSVTNIGSAAFAYCKSLLDIEIPSSITSIGTSAFNECNVLERIVIPKSVVKMGKGVFNYRYDFSVGPLVIYCEAENKPSGWETSWNEGNYPVVWDYKNNEISADGYIYATIDGVKYELKDNVANVCRQSSKITNANILSSINYNGVNYIVKSINKYAFRGCELLQTVLFSEDSQLEHIGEYAFDDCAKLMSVDVGRQIKSVVDLPTSLLSIGESAFSDCIAINYIYIPDNVVEIGSLAFISCDSIKEVRIGASVSRIGDRAFYGCEAINTIRFMDTTTWYRTSNASYTNGTRTDVFSSTDSSLIKYFVEKEFYWYKV